MNLVFINLGTRNMCSVQGERSEYHQRCPYQGRLAHNEDEVSTPEARYLLWCNSTSEAQAVATLSHPVAGHMYLLNPAPQPYIRECLFCASDYHPCEEVYKSVRPT